MSKQIAVFVGPSIFAAAILLARAAPGTEVVEVQPLDDRILMLHFRDGHVVHHGRGQSRSEERVVTSPLDTAAASRPESYEVVSADDMRYARPRHPDRIARKSKGTDSPGSSTSGRMVGP